MKINLPQSYFNKLIRAVVEFDLIHDGDHILIGISGGKDSIFLAYALAILRERLKKDFRLSALTINPMFSEDMNVKRITDFCKSMDIPHEVQDVDIAEAIRQSRNKNACFTCSFFRRGAVNRYATEHDMNKVAYAHHMDDAVETFFMGLLYSGQLTTFSPKTYLDRTGITVIRPLVYFREYELARSVKYHGCPSVPSPCPIDGTTYRQRVKELIEEMSKDNPQLFSHLTAAMRESSLGELWPAAKTRDEMKETYFNYMGKSTVEKK